MPFPIINVKKFPFFFSIFRTTWTSFFCKLQTANTFIPVQKPQKRTKWKLQIPNEKNTTNVCFFCLFLLKRLPQGSAYSLGKTKVKSHHIHFSKRKQLDEATTTVIIIIVTTLLFFLASGYKNSSILEHVFKNNKFRWQIFFPILICFLAVNLGLVLMGI